MMRVNGPRTLEDARHWLYGNGRRWHMHGCAAQVNGVRSGFAVGVSRQCSRDNGYGVSRIYCKQHARMIAKEGS